MRGPSRVTERDGRRQVRHEDQEEDLQRHAHEREERHDAREDLQDLQA